MNKDYIVKKKFIKKDVADLSALYSFYNFLSITSNEGFVDQVPLSHYVYADPLTEGMATLSHLKMEKITGLESFCFKIGASLMLKSLPGMR